MKLCRCHLMDNSCDAHDTAINEAEEMSVKQLQFYYPQNDTCMNVKKDRDNFKFEIQFGMSNEIYVTLDRNQADMLRLYLTEHLK